LGNAVDRNVVSDLLRLCKCRRDDLDDARPEELGGIFGRTEAFSLFPADIGHPPREWAERFFNVQRWTQMPRGGHFAAMEEAELLAADLREWFRQFR
jgi:hypothetical protein